MHLSLNYLNDFVSLFFPELCPACNNSLLKNESVICTDCIYNLPYTNFHLDTENRVSKQLWGRIPFFSASCYLYFRKGSGVQNMLHQLKYNNKPEIALRLGEMYGSILKGSPNFNTAKVVIPVPLHASKLKKRGYNQSEFFAAGLAKALNISISANNLQRVTPTETQTKKSRFLRYENLKDVFTISNPDELSGKHVLLVDDVITTGATIEACALELHKIKDVKLSITAIAFTD